MFKYLKQHQIKFKIVIYEEFLENPLSIMKEICEYIGYGDPARGAEAIDSKLHHHKDVVADDRDWSVAFDVYDACVNRDMSKLLSLDDNVYRKRMEEIYSEELSKDNVPEDLKKLNEGEPLKDAENVLTM